MIVHFTNAVSTRPVSHFISAYQLTGDLPQAMVAALIPALFALLAKPDEGTAHD